MPRALPLAGGLVVLAALIAFPLAFTQPFPRHVMITIFLYAMLAQAWNILAGYCGQISLGHAVFFGTGAYTSSVLVRSLDLSPWAGMVAGALLALLLSQLIGYPVFRLRGHYFAIATIAVGEIVQTLVINWDWVGGARGLFVPIKRPDSFRNFQFHDSKQTYYYIALGLLLLALWLTHRMERSRTGYYFRAIREDQDAAASLGIPVTRYKLRAMALSAALTALGGTFYAQYISEVITAINRDRGLTVVFIEQNVEIALKLAHRGYVRESGRNILEGPAAELLRCPEVRRIFLGA